MLRARPQAGRHPEHSTACGSVLHAARARSRAGRPGKRRPQVDASLFGERDSVQLRTDLIDCHIAVCSMDVLVAFSDNFDYQARLAVHALACSISQQSIKRLLATAIQDSAGPMGWTRAHTSMPHITGRHRWPAAGLRS